MKRRTDGTFNRNIWAKNRQNLSIGNYSEELVNNSTYLGSIINNKKDNEPKFKEFWKEIETVHKETKINALKNHLGQRRHMTVKPVPL